MAKEIERKFLVANDCWRSEIQKTIIIRQGYMRSMDCTVRVRIAGKTGFLTIKGRTTKFTRDEYEYEIPLKDAEEMLINLCLAGNIEKYRHQITFDGNIWVVDEFTGRNTGLVMAEIELDDEFQSFTSPAWLGKEVSHDSRFTNGSLAMKPFLNFK